MTIYTDSLAQRIVLVDLNPYNVSLAANQKKYVGSEFFATEPSDTPAGVNYIGCIKDDVYFNRAMFATGSLGGMAIPDAGIITIINTLEPGAAASRFDSWIDTAQYIWPGSTVSIYVLEKGQAYSAKTTILTGVVSNIDYDENTITFKIKSNQYLLDKLIQSTRYGGAGGADGGSELTGKPKPLAFGKLVNIAPIPVDTTNLVYQIHDGTIQAIDAARDKGSPLTGDGTNYASFAALVAAVITNDYAFSLQAAGSFIRLKTKAVGQLTCDVQGSTLGASYSAKFGDIANYIVTTYSSCSVNSSAITQINSDAGYKQGYYTGIDDKNIQDVLDALAADIWAYYGFNRAGQFDCGIITAPTGTSILSLTYFNVDQNSITRQGVNEVVKTVNMTYRKNWTVQNANELASGITEANRALYIKAGLTLAPDTDGTVTTKYPQAVEMPYSTTIYDSADAQTVADRLLAYYKVERSRYTMQTSLVPLSANLNQIITATFDRFALSSGKKFNTVQFEEFYLAARVQLTIEG